jgi:molybdate transport system regulatory protein
MKVAYKVWLDNDGKAFGEGPYKLLKGVEEKGSLHQAAMDMHMSYRKAWLTLGSIEKKLGFPLITRQVGGVSGGGSQITDAGREFMKQYEGFRGDVKEALESIYKKYFDQKTESAIKHKKSKRVVSVGD